eukprot:10715006-Alexandrium_andersonii.AAC.1
MASRSASDSAASAHLAPGSSSPPAISVSATSVSASASWTLPPLSTCAYGFKTAGSPGAAAPEAASPFGCCVCCPPPVGCTPMPTSGFGAQHEAARHLASLTLWCQSPHRTQCHPPSD